MADVPMSVTSTVGVGVFQYDPNQHVTTTITVFSLVTFVVNTTFVISIGQAIQFTSSVDGADVLNPLHHVIESDITVASAVTKDAVKTLTPDQGTVGQSIGINFELVRSLSDELEFNESVSTWIDQYSYIDPATLNYIGGLTRPSKVTFSVPGHTIQIRKPEFRDTDAYSVFRVDRTSRGGDLHIFQDAAWPTTEILSMEFANLDSQVATDFLLFLNFSLGLDVEFIDYKGQTWTGIILTPMAEIVQKTRFGYTFKMQYQGTIQ